MNKSSGQSDIPTALHIVQTEVNAALQLYFEQQLERSDAIAHNYARLWQAIHDVVLAGGKRLRPYLTVLGYQAFGGKDLHTIMPVAIAQELLHQALLMHDDIIDRDYIRYGHKNVAGTFRDHYAALSNDTATTDHFANSAALLAGDLLLSAAYQFAAQAPHADRVLPMLGDGIFAVGGGELLDSEAVLYEPDTVDSLLIARHKTANYSLVQPLCMGATVADAPIKAIRQLTEVGNAIGTAYQLVDDMLGLFGASKTTGKPDLSDLQEGKRTYIIQQTLLLTNGVDRAIVQQALGNPDATQQDLNQVRRIATDCGAKTAVEAKIDAYKQTALRAFQNIDMNPAVRAALLTFADAALNREK